MQRALPFPRDSRKSCILDRLVGPAAPTWPKESVIRSLLFSTLVVLVVSAALAGGVPAQCLLANPSFEMGGTGGAAFAGWNQFGVVGVATEAAHGAQAALVRGPNSGTWDVSGFWQQLDCAVGEAWTARVLVRHASTRPLTGSCTAIVNIEWRDAAGDLIDYESHTAADAASPTDTYLACNVTSGPAPAGTAATRLLLGVLQSPSGASPDVVFDQVEFNRTTSPTVDDVQWDDFPGGRTIAFAGRAWRVKGPGTYGPGPSWYNDGSESVWVDAADRLHMTIKNLGGTWCSTEVVLTETLGYGDYIFTTYGDLDLMDPHDVLGLFIWQYGVCYSDTYLWWNPYNEFDIELSRWGEAGNELGQFVAQPWDYPGNLDRFGMTFAAGEITSHAFRWRPDRVECRTWRGGPHDESPATLVHTWTYTGPHIPRPEQPRVHINLWQFEGSPAVDQEVILDDFTFVPLGATTPVPDDDSADPLLIQPAARLDAARPNPFNPRTEIGFDLERDLAVDLAIYDLSGRRLCTLVDEILTAGRHTVNWTGLDQRGRRLASGSYRCVLRAGDVIETRGLTLIK